MAKVIGMGGIFFRSDDPKTVRSWSSSRLVLAPAEGGYVVFPWRHDDDPEWTGKTLRAGFSRTTDPFGLTRREFLDNSIVEEREGILADLRDSKAKVNDCEFGRFGWATDPEGNGLDLWGTPS